MRRPRPFRPPAGPAQRHQQAQGDLGFMQAHAGGFSPNQLFDAQVRARQAQQNFERAQKQQSGGDDFFDRAGKALMSSRFTIGANGAPQIMPLVGKTLAIFGKLVPQLQGFGAGVGFGIGVVKTFTDAMVDASHAAGEFGRAALMSGGSSGTIGRLTAMGLAPGDIAGAAAALHARRASDPFAAMAGGPVLPRPFGNPDEAKELEAQIASLRTTKQLYGAEAQLTRARMLGLEGLLDLINVSPLLQTEQQKAADLNKDIFDEKYLQDARDFAGSQKQIDGAWQRLEAAFTKPFINEATAALLGWAEAMDTASKGLNQHTDEIEAKALELAAAGAALLGGPGAAAKVKQIQDFMEGQKIAKDLAKQFLGGPQKGQDANTEAMQKLTEVLLMAIHGGGPRARGAIPPALLAFNNRQAMLDARLDLRGFRY